MKSISAALLAIVAAFISPKFAKAEQECDSTQVIAIVKDRIRDLGRGNPDWLGRIEFWVPYFRMNDVDLYVESIRQKGLARTGMDCETTIRLIPPPDLKATANVVVVTFGYVIISKPNGEFSIDLY